MKVLTAIGQVHESMITNHDAQFVHFNNAMAALGEARELADEDHQFKSGAELRLLIARCMLKAFPDICNDDADSKRRRQQAEGLCAEVLDSSSSSVTIDQVRNSPVLLDII